MELTINLVIGLIAFIHIYIMFFEMFQWTTRSQKVFRSFPKDLFEKTKAMAANQGLYNGFLAAGLIWTFFFTDNAWQWNISLFFLICAAVAGIYGTFTASKQIFIVQALPALIAIVLLHL